MKHRPGSRGRKELPGPFIKIPAVLVFGLKRMIPGFLFQLPLSLSFLGPAPGRPFLRKVMKAPADKSEYSRAAPEADQQAPAAPDPDKTTDHQELGEPEGNRLRRLEIAYLEHPPFTQFAFPAFFTGRGKDVKTCVGLTIATPPGTRVRNAVIDLRYVLHPGRPSRTANSYAVFLVQNCRIVQKTAYAYP